MEAYFAGRAKDSAAAQKSSEVLKCAEDAQVEASAEMIARLRQMINEPTFSDVVFVCSDGKRVQALRKLLAGMSDVLKGMLLNGMAESGSDEIQLPEMSSSALLAVFEFLYTGTLLEHHPQSLKMACEVVRASRFFLLPKLEMITRKTLHAQTSVEATDLQKAASLLTEAIGFKALCEEADLDLTQLVTVLSSNWSKSAHVQSLSEDAFQYLLANSKGSSEEDGKYFSFREYLRFRQVIRWWVCQSELESVATEELVNILAPDERRAQCFCRNPEIVDRGGRSLFPETSPLASAWSCFQRNVDARNAAIRLASDVDYRWIHPVLLANLVAPLGIVSAEKISNSFQYHALRRPLLFKTPECVWEHGESYGTREQGYVIHRTGSTIGIAVMAAAMSSSIVNYHWRFVYEDGCTTFAEFGILYYARRAGGGAEKAKLEGARLSDQYHARVLKFHDGRTFVNWDRDNGHLIWKELDIVRNTSARTTIVFDYSTSNDICSLSINEKNFGAVWKNLPKEIYYPAVSLGDSSRGRVRVEFGPSW